MDEIVAINFVLLLVGLGMAAISCGVAKSRGYSAGWFFFAGLSLLGLIGALLLSDLNKIEDEKKRIKTRRSGNRAAIFLACLVVLVVFARLANL